MILPASRLRHNALCVSALLFGLIIAGSGLSALLDPFSWFLRTPGVADTGAFNSHFVRDIAVAYLVSGSAFFCGAIWTSQRPGLWTTGGSWLAGHAGVHIWEFFWGICSAATFYSSVPGVLVPAGIALFLCGWAMVEGRAGSDK
jgi:hypothetical protein